MTERPRRLGAPLIGFVGIAAAAIGLIVVATPASAASRPATTVKVLRAVTGSGHAAHGWKVVTDHRAPIDCNEGEASYVAVDRGIAFCGSSADYTLACWKSATPHHVLCIDPSLHKTLRSIRIAGRFSSGEPVAYPQALTLTMRSGLTFLARDGGAASTAAEHPNWVAYYYQRGGDRSIYAPRQRHSGLDRSHPAWKARVYSDTDKPGYDSYVGTAYFVGTAH